MAVSFTLSLVDKMTSPAKSITGAMGSLVQQAKTLTSAIKSTEAQMTRANALGDVAKVQQLTEKLGAYRSELSKIPSDARETAAGINESGVAMEALGGAAAGAIAAVGALAVGVGVLVVKGAELALQATEARKKLEATFKVLSGSDQVVDQLDGLTSKLGMTREQLAPLAEQLLGMGVPLSQLQGHLTALATVTAVGINGGTEAYLGLLKKLSAETKVSSKSLAELYKTGVNVAEVAQAMGMSTKQLQAGLKAGTVDAKALSGALEKTVTAKGAVALANQAESLTATIAIAKEKFTDLFTGIDASPFLGALKDLVGVLDQANPSGQFLKKTLTVTFNEVFKIAGKVVAFLKHSFLQLIVWGLQGYIAMKPLIRGLKEFWEQHNMSDKLLSALKYIGIALGVAAGIAAALVAAAVAVAASLIAIQLASAGAVAWIGTKIVGAFGAVMGAMLDWAKGAVDIAAAFVNGLLNGIKAGASKVVDAVKDLGGEMLGGVKSVLGIHSPSAEMMKLGVHTATGFAQGVAAGNDNAFAASSGMAASVTAGASAGAGGGGGGTYNLYVTVQGGNASAQEIALKTKDAVVDFFESMALTQGVSTAA